MISGKIILKSATKVSLDKRFSDIAKQTPPTPTPRVQQANIIIPHSRQELFGRKQPAVVSIAARLKKRSINYRPGISNRINMNRPDTASFRPRVFQRLSGGNRRRGGRNNIGANSYLFGGQSGMGVRLRGQGRIGGTRPFRFRTRGYLNNNFISRSGGYSTRGNRNKNNRGRRTGNNNNFNRSNRGRGGRGKNFNRGRGNRNNNNNRNTTTKEGLDNDLDIYMGKTKQDNDSMDMNAI